MLMLRIFAIAAGLVLVVPPVFAHKVLTAVWTTEDAIEGEVGFSNGDMAEGGTVVEVFGPDGRKLGETRTDADGLFSFTPAEAVDHTFKADLGAGHVAEVTLVADELPPAVLAGGSRLIGTAEASPVTGAVPVAAVQDLDALVREAVRREVLPLRRELTAYKEQNDLQRILGGIGYICGVFGLLFFVYARRKAR